MYDQLRQAKEHFELSISWNFQQSLHAPEGNMNGAHFQRKYV